MMRQAFETIGSPQAKKDSRLQNNRGSAGEEKPTTLRGTLFTFGGPRIGEAFLRLSGKNPSFLTKTPEPVKELRGGTYLKKRRYASLRKKHSRGRCPEEPVRSACEANKKAGAKSLGRSLGEMTRHLTKE